MASREGVKSLVDLLTVAFGDEVRKKFPDRNWYELLYVEVAGFTDEELQSAGRAMLREKAALWANENAFAVILDACSEARTRLEDQKREALALEQKRRDKADRDAMSPEQQEKNKLRIRGLMKLLAAGDTAGIKRLTDQARAELPASIGGDDA